ncbi:uncharacterized protein LOC141590641 [Silene latifolia]|uniref:uncharacterized protein LOC141590641 n=1 Tax=Silene latifolia TaxID=37657 RepID=UPI003D7762D5
MSFILNFHALCLLGDSVCLSHVRIKCDAAWTRDLKASGGWFFQSSDGMLLHSGATSFWASSSFQAEAMALFLALQAALSFGYHHIDANSDCLQLVMQLGGVANIAQDIKALIGKIQRLLLYCHCFSISYCPRHLNRIAHSLAKSALA